MRKYGLAAVLACTLAIGGASLASGDSGFGPGKTIVLTGTTVQRSIVHTDASGFALGDQAVFTNDLSANGKPAGVDGGVCTVVRIADQAAQTGTVQCQLTYSLSGGQVTAQGLMALSSGGFAGKQTAAITGGTGLYREARGVAVLEFVHPGELTVTLALR
jgi:Allene oxide cyclase barrel like domain